MDKKFATLLDAARQAQHFSYSPYSGFKVGAALLADDGHTYQGCNVENASYPLGQCAEGGAISAMIASGGKKIKQILIISPNSTLCPPCGGCRQKIKEFSATSDTQILLSDCNGNITVKTIEQLLPMAFDLD